MTEDHGTEGASRKDPNGWGTDRDLSDLDMWMAGRALPVAEGPITWSTATGDESENGTEVHDRHQLLALLAALASGTSGTASRKAVRVQVVNVAEQNEEALLILEFLGDSPDEPPLRIFRGLRDSHYDEAPLDDRGFRKVETVDAEAAARIIWSALETGLPVGYYSTPVQRGKDAD